jgi:hypothetical protein
MPTIGARRVISRATAKRNTPASSDCFRTQILPAFALSLRLRYPPALPGELFTAAVDNLVDSGGTPRLVP